MRMNDLKVGDILQCKLGKIIIDNPANTYPENDHYNDHCVVTIIGQEEFTVVFANGDTARFTLEFCKLGREFDRVTE